MKQSGTNENRTEQNSTYTQYPRNLSGVGVIPHGTLASIMVVGSVAVASSGSRASMEGCFLGAV